jgi:inorganic triphosphatase YgiF
MRPLPTANLRRNLGTWAVPTAALPRVAVTLRDALPPEAYDPGFDGQRLETAYFDTPGFDLRKARRRGERYLTLRLRCYGQNETYALSAKTEDEKWRHELPAAVALALLDNQAPPEVLPRLLPGNLLARLQELVGDAEVVPIVRVCCTRYAVEDDADRLTLDVGVATDTGKCLAAHVLEFKSTEAAALPPGAVGALGLRPVKLSKFLWATLWR